jgi:hypothetical protein
LTAPLIPLPFLPKTDRFFHPSFPCVFDGGENPLVWQRNQGIEEPVNRLFFSLLFSILFNAYHAIIFKHKNAFLSQFKVQI